MTECPLWKVVMIDVDLALERFRQMFARAKGRVARTALMRPLQRAIRPLVWGWRGGVRRCSPCCAWQIRSQPC